MDSSERLEYCIWIHIQLVIQNPKVIYGFFSPSPLAYPQRALLNPEWASRSSCFELRAAFWLYQASLIATRLSITLVKISVTSGGTPLFVPVCMKARLTIFNQFILFDP